jgi:AraC-like DNA-binding protein
LRLDRCHQDLLNPACARKSITEVAYSWGFNNSSHFSRCFKRAFGASPRRFRSEFASWAAVGAAAHSQKSALPLPSA